MKNSLLLNKFFQDNNIEYIFGNPGTTETPFMNALNQNKKVKYILGLQENSVIGIAAGYGLASNKIPFVNVHTYPGLANSMTNIYTAFQSKIPMLITAGQQHRKHLAITPVLSGPLTTLANTATKSAREIHFEGDFQYELQRAYNTAQKAPQGPTFVSIPMDTIEAQIGDYRRLSPLHNQVKSTVDKEELRDWLSSEKSQFNKVGIIVDGVATEASSEIMKFSEYLNADVFTTPFPVKIAVPTNHYLYKGGLSALANEQKNTLASYDLIVIIGDALDHFLFDGMNSIPEGKKVIQINNSNENVGENYPVLSTIIGDFNAIFKTLNVILEEEKWMKKVEVIKHQNEHSRQLAKDREAVLNRADDKFELDKITYTILDHLEKDTTLVLEASSYEGKLEQLIKRKVVGKTITAPKGGGLGWAMPVAIGASLATQKHSVCFVGDGGFQYAVQAIYTAKKYKIPVIFIVLNNEAYEVLKELWKVQFPDSHAEDYKELDLKPEIDILGISKGYGALTFEPKDIETLKFMLDEALLHQGPSVINIKL